MGVVVVRAAAEEFFMRIDKLNASAVALRRIQVRGYFQQSITDKRTYLVDYKKVELGYF